LILDGHGFFSLAAAERIAEAMQSVRPLWMEDVLRPDNVETMALFRRRVRVPIAVSEMLVTRDQYHRALVAGAADYVMIDPTWVGGIGETRRIAELAQLFNVPVVMHDCTGPLTLLAGLHVTAATPIVAWQETVRAHLATLYEHLIDEPLAVHEGTLPIPERPGLGARWLDSLFAPDRPGYRCSSP
jgi:galactonate dehydratase